MRVSGGNELMDSKGPRLALAGGMKEKGGCGTGGITGSWRAVGRGSGEDENGMGLWGSGR